MCDGVGSRPSFEPRQSGLGRPRRYVGAMRLPGRRKASTKPATNDKDVAAALRALRGLDDALRRARRGLAPRLGLSSARLYVLRLLAERPAQSVNDLAVRTGTHQSTVSVMVARLAARGLVARGPSVTDARRVVLSLTASGRALLQRTPQHAEEQLAAALARLSRRDRRDLARGLERLVGELTDALEAEDARATFLEEPPLRPRLARRHGLRRRS
jgi:DNA-binding MarR family transcriptional regulator